MLARNPERSDRRPAASAGLTCCGRQRPDLGQLGHQEAKNDVSARLVRAPRPPLTPGDHAVRGTQGCGRSPISSTPRSLRVGYEYSLSPWSPLHPAGLCRYHETLARLGPRDSTVLDLGSEIETTFVRRCSPREVRVTDAAIAGGNSPPASG